MNVYSFHHEFLSNLKEIQIDPHVSSNVLLRFGAIEHSAD